MLIFSNYILKLINKSVVKSSKSIIFHTNVIILVNKFIINNKMNKSNLFLKSNLYLINILMFILKLITYSFIIKIYIVLTYNNI